MTFGATLAEFDQFQSSFMDCLHQKYKAEGPVKMASFLAFLRGEIEERHKRCQRRNNKVWEGTTMELALIGLGAVYSQLARWESGEE